MAKSREQIEREINETPYFSITGDNTEALRKTELYRLSALVFEYCKRFMYIKGEKATLYGVEIYKCTKHCLENYQHDKSVPFLHYLKAALAREIKHAEYREKETIRKMGRDHTSAQQDDGYSLVDKQTSHLANPEDKLIEQETILTELGAIESVFKTKQDRVKPYLKKLVTREYFDSIIRFFGSYSFVDMEMVKNVSLNREILPTQKEVAESFGRHEADASRTLHNFIKEVKEKLKEKC